jgi:hypothetical protein
MKNAAGDLGETIGELIGINKGWLKSMTAGIQALDDYIQSLQITDTSFVDDTLAFWADEIQRLSEQIDKIESEHKDRGIFGFLGGKQALENLKTDLAAAMDEYNSRLEELRKETEDWAFGAEKQDMQLLELREDANALSEAITILTNITNQNTQAINKNRFSLKAWLQANELALESSLKGLALSADLRESSRALANQYIVEGVFAAAKSALEEVPFPFNLIAAAGAATAANALFNAIVPVKKAALGTDFVTEGPQVLIVGDNPGGRERVQVTPLSSPNVEGPSSTITVNIMGGVVQEDYVRNELIPAIEKAKAFA